MKPLLFLFVSLFLGNCLNAQTVGIFHYEEIKTMEDAWGRPIRPQTTYQVEGSPFFPLDYSKARISFENGKFNSSVRARINFYDNSILYQGDNSQELELIIPVISIEFIDSSQKIFTNFKRYPDVEGLSPEILYEVLETGKATLLIQHLYTYRDFSPYGTAVITRTFSSKKNYFVIRDGVVFRIGKKPADLLEFLDDKRPFLEKFIGNKNFNLKSETDLLVLIRHYNSL